MTNALVFQWIKRAEERQLRPVRFASSYGTFEINFFSVEIYDADGNNVTDELLDDTKNAYSGDTVEFMLIEGDVGAQYDVYVKAHSATTELPIARATLTIIP